MTEQISTRLSRRTLLAALAGAAGTAILSACGGGNGPGGALPTSVGTGVATAAAVQATATGMAGTASAATPIGTIGGPAGTPSGGGTPRAAGSAPASMGATTGTTTGTTTAGSAVAGGPYMGKKLNIALVVNGNLGDKSFFDSAQRGMDRVKAELGMTTKTIELGTDQNKWLPGLTDAAAGPYDLIILGTFDMVEPLQEVAPTAPNKKFILFDQNVDYSKGSFKNVYSLLFKQNEGSYLVGYLSGLMLQSTDANITKGTGGGKKVGFLGGSKQPVIDDFLVGTQQGAKDAGLNPMSDVLVSYIEGANPFSDPAKGKELSLALYSQGAGIGYQVAGASGLGMIEAAAQQKRWVVGVDSDQYTLLKTSKPDQAPWIVTSMQKRVDNGLYRAIRLAGEGTLMFGAVEAIGLKDGGVELADNENYQKIVPQDMRDKVTAKAKSIASGEIKVDTAIK